jgi:serine phosphatase RsbU (regulator of sigma subunit)/tetratricopeptide (TPR) repeat protein
MVGALWLVWGGVQAQNVNDLLEQLAQAQLPQQKAQTCYKIGARYHQQGVYKKALEYYQKSLKNEPNQALTLRSIAVCHTALRDYDAATGVYKQLLHLHKQNNDTKAQQSVLQQLAQVSKLDGNYQDAIQYTRQTLTINQQMGNTYGQANALNNLGFLYQKLDDTPNSLKAFQKTLVLIRDDQSTNGRNVYARTLLNVGVAYSYLRNYKGAQSSYAEALQIRQVQGEPIEVARVHNYIAIHSYIYHKHNQAIAHVQKAIKLAEVNQQHPQANQVLQVSYKLLAQVYQKENDFKAYQKYYAKHLALKEKIVENDRAKQQQMLENQLKADKKENQFKMLLAEKEKQALSVKQLKLEADKKEQALVLKAKELELLKRNQELQNVELKNQQLEKDRVVQLLALAEQKAHTEKQKALAAKQKQEAARQKLLTAKEKAEKLQQAKALEAAQKEKALQNEQLKQEKNLRRYTTIVLLLGSLLFLLMLISFLASQKARKKLKRKNAEIQKQNLEIQQQKEEIASRNEELQQSQEEVMVQRDFIEQQNKELKVTNQRLLHGEQVLRKAYTKLQDTQKSVKEKNKALNAINSRINNSISVAQTIQNAILPRTQKMDKVLKEYFTIYRPKDVVSGDFYWAEKVKEYTFLIAADCTGHGVPGAMMSMIGNTLIDKVILIKKVYEPNQILEDLHKEIGVALNQEESGDDNGMDLAIVRMHQMADNKVNVTFCGAKNPLYYIKQGSRVPEVLKGDRRSIGGCQPEFLPFTNQEIILEKNSLIYLSSDGFVDQNNEKRISFGNKKLRKLLEACASMPMAQQKQAIEQALDDQMKNTTQRDDILFMGVKV